MRVETEGFVLRQTKTSYNRRVLHLFTSSYGKISAGTDITGKNRTKSTLALQPFTHGRYNLFGKRDSYNIDSAEVVKSYYKIAEDVDKYMNGSYILELTDKVLEEGVPAAGIFNLMKDFFEVLEKRTRGFGTLVLAYQIKLLKHCGVMPELERCTLCGKEISHENAGFSVENGGVVCDECKAHNSLIYNNDFDIISIIKYLAASPITRLENVALKGDAGQYLQKIIREYMKYYLDISDIKSEKLI